MEDQQPPRSVQAVFEDYKKRREGLVKALTTDVDIFYEQCDPEKENLCLYGFPDGTWEVQLPADEVPPELPEPALGINFARDGMRRNDWLALVAVHSDAWLMAVAFYYGAKFGPTERCAQPATSRSFTPQGANKTSCKAQGGAFPEDKRAADGVRDPVW